MVELLAPWPSLGRCGDSGSFFPQRRDSRNLLSASNCVGERFGRGIRAVVMPS
jgi:hypothetical protein